MISKAAEKAIAQHFHVPHDVRRMAQRAAFDLYFGPIGTEQDYDDDAPYPGFSEACEIVSTWCDDNLSEVWFDSEAGCISDREPEGYDEECNECSGSGFVVYGDPDEDEACPCCGGDGEVWVEPEECYHFEVVEVKRALFNTELVAYI